MPTSSRRLAFVAFAVLALAFAWQSLRTAEPFGRDRALIEALDGRSLGESLDEWWAVAAAVDPAAGHPLAVLSAAASVTVYRADREDSRSALVPARLENLAWYLLASLGLARFLRRFFLPWTGSEQAEAAGWAAALFFGLSPLAFPLVASLSARGDVLGLALGASAAAIFLAGRQDYSFHRQAAALVLALLAGLASDAALFLAPLLALAEFVSARRQRPRTVRTRTAATTLVVFAAATAVGWFVRAATDAPRVMPAAWGDLAGALGEGRWLELCAGTLEKLGLVVLPINAWALGLFGQGVAGVLLLVAIQPGLLAARTAPRLWSFLLGVISAVFVVALTFAPFTGVSSRDLTASGSLALPAMVLCAALGAAATSLSGLRRWLVPLVFAGGSAFLAHLNSLPWVRASHALSRLAASVADARAQLGNTSDVVVLDPPRATLGVDVATDALAALDGRVEGRGRVLGLARDALPLFAGSRRFQEALERGLVLLVPGPPSAGAEGTFAGFEARAPVALRHGVATEPAAQSRRWFNDGRSPRLDLPTVSHLALVVRAKPDAQTAKPPRVGWRAADESTHEHAGVWWRRGGEPTAVFDLASSLEWLASERVARVWSVEGWAVTTEAELAAALPPVPGASEPRVEGADWHFAPDATAIAAEDLSRARFALTLLSLEDLSSRRATLSPGGAGEDLRFVGAETAARSLRACVWSLDLELDGRAVARSSGSR